MNFLKICLVLFMSFWFISNATAEQKLKFKKPVQYSKFKNVSNAVFLPSKELTKLTPAVVLLPVCSGIWEKTSGDYSRWAKTFTENGYVVLIVDHYTRPGTFKSGCTLNRKVGEVQITKDLYDAVEYLSNIKNIDKNRIFSLGFSLGSLANALAASEKMDKRIGKGRLRPRAVGSLYGGCKFGDVARFLFNDTNIPVIWLMASEDKEVPPADCLETLEEIRKKNKAPIVWHTYEGATHCWDCRAQSGTVRTAHNNGVTSRYTYSEKFTKDSEKRVIDFFNSFK